MTNRFLIIARVINVGSAVNRLSLLLQKKNGNENEMNENEQAFRERKVDRGSRLVNNDLNEGLINGWILGLVHHSLLHSCNRGSKVCGKNRLLEALFGFGL